MKACVKEGGLCACQGDVLRNCNGYTRPTDDRYNEAARLLKSMGAGYIEDPVEMVKWIKLAYENWAEHRPTETAVTDEQIKEAWTNLCIEHGCHGDDLNVQIVGNALQQPDKTVDDYQELERLDGVMLKYRDEAFKLREVLKGVRIRVKEAHYLLYAGTKQGVEDNLNLAISALNKIIGDE